MRTGFTLIETLIYLFIVGLILSTLGLFVNNLIQARAKTMAASQVLTAARTIQDQLATAARHAQAINTSASTFDSDPGVLSLDMVDAGVDPTVFSLTQDDGQFRKTQAGGVASVLTPQNVEVTNLLFTNLTGASEIGIIQVQFTVSAVNTSGSAYFDYVQSFQTTLRIPLD